MRKALIAAAVATALFAVGAFAASFAVSGEDIASGNDQVQACAPNVKVDFGQPTYVPATKSWTVSSATVSFHANATATATVATCNGGNGVLKITTMAGPGNTPPANNEAATGTITNIAGGTQTVTFTAVPLHLVNGTAVMVDNVFLSPVSIP